ncbi:MAG: metallophosphoesterase [Sphingomicrobium sp.]
MRVYAVGDVHGCAIELDRLLTIIADECRTAQVITHLIFLGDLIDRGPASAEVVARLERRDLPGDRHDFLMGNHEEIMVRVFDGDVGHLEGWLKYGGVQTLESYGIEREEILRLGLDLPSRMRDCIPHRDMEFLRNFRDQLRIGDYLFVHAGIRPGVALAEQSSRDLRWIRQGFLDDSTDHGFFVIHGHTICEEPDIASNRIGVDTGCYQSGRLTAIVLEGASRRFLHSAE